VDGLALDIEGCHPSGCQHSDIFAGCLPEVIEERRFPCTGFSRDENVSIRILHNVEGFAEFWVYFYGLFFLLMSCDLSASTLCYPN
jgi:hypothetical protein